MVTDIILFAHPTFGVLGILSALWVFVEVLNASESNRVRIRRAALIVPLFMVLAWGLGGYWYITHYSVDKALILNGPWPFAHDLFMETKEHLFFIPAILALYLPIVAAANLAANKGARTMVLVVAALIVVNGLAIEGAGIVIDHGAKLSLMQWRAK